MARFSLELSDGLADLAGLFDNYTHEARVLDPDDARAFRACVRLLLQRARELENEVSRHRWNDEARREREAQEAIVAEAMRPGTNLRLFALPHRPIGDGRTA